MSATTTTPATSLKFGALLHAKWEAGLPSPDVIIGRWAEDLTTYRITIPGQLRDLMIELQNRLADQYMELVELRAKLAKLESLYQRSIG